MSLSYWQADAGLLGQEAPPVRPIDIETELCIIGAGIIGTGSAQWAAQAGLRGVIVEARQPAMGATGRNAGFIMSGIADNYYRAVETFGREVARELWALTVENRNVMLDFAERLGVPLNRRGSLLLAESEEEAEELAKSATLLAEDGFPGEFTPHDPLNRGFMAGLRRPADGVTQPAALTRALLQDSGFDFIPASPVTHFEEVGHQVVIHSERATIRARWLLLATNAWAARVHPYFEGKVVPMRGQLYVTEPAPMIFDTAGYSHYGFWYFRQVEEPGQTGYGRWLMGGGRHLHFDTENNNPSEEPTAPVQADLEAWTALHFPEFSAVPISYRWAGTMGFTPDGLPLVGWLPGHDRVAFCVGFNGHGMGLGVMVAQRALAMMIEGRSPGLFDAQRLG
ncbi:MAG: FAD-binding oxidoreductase [Ardenticatenales bacterium]|nr:FAD-binding oxidoreductase [Ardenticatenales bacterium]